jgi:hypothetical protein
VSDPGVDRTDHRARLPLNANRTPNSVMLSSSNLGRAPRRRQRAMCSCDTRDSLTPRAVPMSFIVISL